MTLDELYTAACEEVEGTVCVKCEIWRHAHHPEDIVKVYVIWSEALDMHIRATTPESAMALFIWERAARREKGDAK